MLLPSSPDSTALSGSQPTWKALPITYLFMAALGLCCHARALSSCSEQRFLSSYGMWASYCDSFSYCSFELLEHRLSGFDAQA